ncbi:helicase HerA domain-containing protein, partial [Pseudomonas synxantha]|uniref:helicase HerA domain-containing protein n=1 Tax=Pseudomonas synxantha TaxID=47883 RepID=UPI0022B82F2A
MLDLHGEYGSALKTRANIYKINPHTKSNIKEKGIYITYWELNFDELCELSFG